MPQVAALAKMVAKLRAENERLERLASTTAVLERAKGVVMAQTGCSSAAAYAELTQRARTGGRTLAEECWIALGEIPRGRFVPTARRPPESQDGSPPERSSPDGSPHDASPPDGSPPEGSVFDSARYTRHSTPRAAGRRSRTEADLLSGLGEALAGVTGTQELAERLLDNLAGPPVQADAVMIFLASADGTLELGGHAGTGAATAAQWRSVPPVSGIAALDVVRTGEPVWMEDVAEAARQYHLIGESAQRWPTRAWLPVTNGETVTAALGVLRTVGTPFGPGLRELLHRVAQLCAGSLHMCDGSSAPPPGRDAELVQAVFDALPGPAALLTPLRSPAGEVEDFRIDAAAPHSVDVAGRHGHQLVSLRVLECYPTMAGSPAWHGFLGTLETGRPYESGPLPYEEVVAGVRRLSTYSVRAARLGNRLVVTWVGHDPADRQQELLADLQRLGNLGWTDWNLVTDTITWSPQVYAIFDRDRALGPMTLEELPGRLLPEDLPAFARAVQSLLGDGTPVDHPFRCMTATGVKHLRLVAEAVQDAHGTPVEVRGFVQDLTAQRRAELALLESQQAVLAQRGVLQAERTVAARLQHALLPHPGRSLGLADLQVNVAYLPSHDDLNVGGDWYSAVEMPDGCVLFAVGDVAGHGIDAVATMAQLRFTAKGMVFTGSSLTGALHRLNTLLLHTHETHATATLVLGRYDPADRCLTWAQAGHLPPLLVRRGKTELLTPPEGILLGATLRPSFGEAACRLEPGDHLLLYTDGLVERPGEHLDVGFGRLADAAGTEYAKGGTGSLDALLTRLLPDEQLDDVCLLDVHLPPEGGGCGAGPSGAGSGAGPSAGAQR
ncbi:transcription antitermination regulator [Streptomyces hiroshimensis]|uniref:Transcription antitermination regulator n=1 Tax=Streptomyces hiroshimensis TaxID=66424 RepID=A0ABQ2Y8X6_9ACTN|nr:transcription antitermination regulator [Streptomyces hiroshimensis]